MPAQLLQNVVQKFFDANGAPLAGGKLYSYEAGTTTPLATYTDESAGVPNTNPVILDASGAASIWITNAGYKFVLKDASDVVQWSVDNVYNVVPGSIGNTELAGSIPVSKLDLSDLTSSDLPAGCINGATNIQDASIPTAKLEDASVTFPKIDPNLDLTKFNQTCELVFSNKGAMGEGVIEAIPQYPWTAPAILSDPAILPTGSTGQPSWSSDGKFLAIPHQSSPYITIYERTGSKLTKLADPDILPGVLSLNCSLSPDGNLLAVGRGPDGSPFQTSIYLRCGKTFSFLFNLSAGGSRVSWSPDGQYLALAGAETLSIFKIGKENLISENTGDNICWLATLSSMSGSIYPGMVNQSTGTGHLAIVSVPNATQIIIQSVDGTVPTTTTYNFSGPSVSGSVTISSIQPIAAVYPYFSYSSVTSATISTSTMSSVKWSPDGAYVTVTHNVSPYVTTYSFDGSALSAVTAPASLPPSSSLAAAWSPDGQYLAIGSTASPYILVYQWDGSTFTALTAPASLPTGSVAGISWSPNGRLLALAIQASPYVMIYSFDGTTFTLLAQPTDLPTGNGVGVVWSPSNQFLTVTGNVTPYIFNYKTTGSIPSNSLLYVREVFDV